MFKRYPYTIGLLLVVSIVCCLAWLLTHDACMHPLGNGLAAWWAFVNAPLFLIGLIEGGGRRIGMSLCWQQITFCAVALVLVLANVGTAQKRREKPSTTVSSVCMWVALCLLVLSI